MTKDFESILYKERNELIDSQLKARGIFKPPEKLDYSMSTNYLINAFNELMSGASHNDRIPWADIIFYFEWHGESEYDIINLYVRCIRKMEEVYKEYIDNKYKNDNAKASSRVTYDN